MSLGFRLLAIAFLVPTISSGAAQDLGSARYPSLGEIVANASVVARVRIVETKTLEFEVAESTYSCGLALKAEVLESVVGSSDNFWFFVAPGDDYDANAEEHLVVAKSNSLEEADARLKLLADYVSRYDIEYARCAASVPYSTALPVQALIPFEKNVSFDGSWLRPNRVSVALLAITETREVEVDGSPVLVFSWPDLRSAIDSVGE